MADQTKIAWCDSTFNGWVGCTAVSPACDSCYAQAMMEHRYHRVKWGAGQPRSRTSAENWKHPLRWNDKPFYECLDCGARFAPPSRKEGYVTCPGCGPCGGKHGDKEDAARLGMARRRVFCSSLSDWLDNEVPIEWLADLLDLIRRTPNLDWLLLTKRIGNFDKRLGDVYQLLAKYHANPQLAGWVDRWRTGVSVPSNVWMGNTVVTQPEAERDVPKLLSTPALVRFVSVEPMLEPIDVNAIRFLQGTAITTGDEGGPEYTGGPRNMLHWVIVGGESGSNTRMMEPDWARSVRDQCAQTGIAFFMKQMTDLAEIPPDLMVRQFPGARP